MAAPLYLYARIKLRYGKLSEFSETMTALIPMVERHGWKLIASWCTVIGDINEVHDVWQIEDANTIPETMAAFAAEAGFPEHMQALTEQVESEVFSLVTKTSFSP